jgi:demethylmenaquinone methyltransferase / 2-methoxy-6-polyprenyl-1,4-benzoquinol methylase
MFASIARAYDLNNRLHSLWRDQAWRKAAVAAAQVVRRTGVSPVTALDSRDGCPTGNEVLDVACGTGDLAGLFDRAGASRVVGTDFCGEMLDVARRKFRHRPIEWVLSDAHELPFADGSFDVVSIAFGLRNLVNPPRALVEFFRVLRPGGRLIVLEFDPRPQGLAGRMIRRFISGIMVHTAGALAHDRHGAYDYLCKSVQSFLTSRELAEAIRRAGFVDVQTRGLTWHTVALHRGKRP